MALSLWAFKAELPIKELQIFDSESGHVSTGGSVFAMFHLDYLSCFLTVLATILLARKSWIGLLIAIVNSLIVCAIGLRTSQLGFIPGNLICICVYAFSIRSWVKKTHTHRIRQRWGLGLRRRQGSTLSTLRSSRTEGFL